MSTSFRIYFLKNNTKTCIQIQREVAKHDMRERNFEADVKYEMKNVDSGNGLII